MLYYKAHFNHVSIFCVYSYSPNHINSPPQFPESMNPDFKKYLLSTPRGQKRLLLVFIDIILVSSILWLSFSLRFNMMFVPNGYEWLIFPLAVVICVPIFIRMGLYRAVLKYFPSQAIVSIIVAALFSTVVWVGAVNLLHIIKVPASVALMFWLGLFALVTSVRLISKYWLYRDYAKTKKGKNLLIYGAGEAGVQLATILKTDASYNVLGFLDDDKSLAGWNISGLKVYASEQVDKLVNNKK